MGKKNFAESDAEIPAAPEAVAAPVSGAEKLEPYLEIGKRKGLELWVVKATAAYHQWANGREVSEAVFDAAVKKTLGVDLAANKRNADA